MTLNAFIKLLQQGQTFTQRGNRRKMKTKSPTVKFREQRQQIQNETCVKNPLPAQGRHFPRDFTLFL